MEERAMEETMLRPGQAAKKMGVDRKTIWNYVTKGYVTPDARGFVDIEACKVTRERLSDKRNSALKKGKAESRKMKTEEITLEERARRKLPSATQTFRGQNSIDNRWRPVTVYDEEAECPKQFLFELVIREGSPVWKLHSVSFGGGA